MRKQWLPKIENLYQRYHTSETGGLDANIFVFLYVFFCTKTRHSMAQSSTFLACDPSLTIMSKWPIWPFVAIEIPQEWIQFLYQTSKHSTFNSTSSIFLVLWECDIYLTKSFKLARFFQGFSLYYAKYFLLIFSTNFINNNTGFDPGFSSYYSTLDLRAFPKISVKTSWRNQTEFNIALGSHQ